MKKKTEVLPALPPLANAYEVVALHATATKSSAPVTGKSYYIVLEVERNQLTLLHPFSFTKFTMGRIEFLESQVTDDWQPTAERLADLLETKISQNKRWGHETPSYVKLLAKHYRNQA